MSKPMILGAMGQAVANSGRDISNMMMQGIQHDQAAAQRIADREDRQAETRERDAMYRRTAEQQMAGKKKAGGDDFAPDEGMIAGKAGLTIPELRSLDEAGKSGDFGAFKTKQREDDVGPTQYDPAEFDSARATYPPGVSDETIRSKMKQIADIRVSIGLGKDNKGYEEGNQTRQQIGVADGIIKGTMDRDKAAGAIGASLGKETYGGNSDVTRDNYNGKTSVTPVGQSVIRENDAQANRAATGPKDETLKALTQERLLATNAASAAASELKALEASGKSIIRAAEKEEHAKSVTTARAKLAQYEKQRDDLAGRIRQFTDAGGKTGTKPDAPAPAATSPKAPAPKYADGTRLRGPGGKMFVVRNGNPVPE